MGGKVLFPQVRIIICCLRNWILSRYATKPMSDWQERAPYSNKKSAFQGVMHTDKCKASITNKSKSILMSLIKTQNYAKTNLNPRELKDPKLARILVFLHPRFLMKNKYKKLMEWGQTRLRPSKIYPSSPQTTIM